MRSILTSYEIDIRLDLAAVMFTRAERFVPVTFTHLCVNVTGFCRHDAAAWLSVLNLLAHSLKLLGHRAIAYSSEYGLNLSQGCTGSAGSSP